MMLLNTEHMFVHLGVVVLNNKKRIVNEFIEMCEPKMEFEERIEIFIGSNGVMISLMSIVDNFFLVNSSVEIEMDKHVISINLKEYEVKLIEDEGIFTLSFKNESNEIRISI